MLIVLFYCIASCAHSFVTCYLCHVPLQVTFVYHQQLIYVLWWYPYRGILYNVFRVRITKNIGYIGASKIVKLGIRLGAFMYVPFQPLHSPDLRRVVVR